MKVNICGITHNVIEKEDNFTSDTYHFGEIDYPKAEIYLNRDLPGEVKKETLCHEILHGMLVHLGYADLSQDEKFVQALGNAIYQTFEVKDIEKGKK